MTACRSPATQTFWPGLVVAASGVAVLFPRNLKCVFSHTGEPRDQLSLGPSLRVDKGSLIQRGGALSATSLGGVVALPVFIGHLDELLPRLETFLTLALKDEQEAVNLR